MKKIEFSTEVKFGDTVIDTIEVNGLTFMDLADIWNNLPATGKPEVNLQRARFLRQTHFKAAGKRVIPDLVQLNLVPIAVAKEILANLDIDQGEPGELLNNGDGVTSPVHYKLGTPITMKDAKGEIQAISELEFEAKTYGDVEEILAADNDIQKAIILLTNLAAPVGSSLPRLPGWALDRFTTSDGVSIMRLVLPRF